MSGVVEDFFPIFEEVATKLKAIKEAKVKVKADTSRPNDIYINPKIKADFKRMLEQEVPVHVAIGIYDEWFDELYRLAIVNEPWLSHPKVFEHVAEILTICATFQDVLEAAKQGMNLPQPSV